MTTDVENPMSSTDSRSNEVQAVGIARRTLTAIAGRLANPRSRINLSGLSDEQLKDIGLSRFEAGSKVNKSWFWG